MSLSAASTLPVTVTYATADGTGPEGAVANQDYIPVAPTTLIFAPGQLKQLISVVGYLEPDISTPKTFTVNLSDPVNAVLASGHSSGTATVLGYNGGKGAGNPTIIPQVAPFVTIGPAR